MPDTLPLLPRPAALAPSTASLAAATALEAAIWGMLGHRADAGQRLAAALAADPGLALGHAIAGLQARMLARREMLPAAQRSLEAARESLRQRGGTAREHLFVRALADWQEGGDMEAAAITLEQQLAEQPLDAAALKLAHGIRFMLGDAPGMRLAVERALPAWNDALPGAGYVLGCHAFALEETGDIAAAERIGRHAVALEPGDLWAAHAVAHTLEGSGRAREGLGWLDSLAAQLPELGNFGRHIFWHRALFHLHLGEGEAALALYDRRVRDEPTEDFRDLANAASLLWRLESQRVPVGAARWDELADIAERRIGDHSLVFADLHHVISLAAAGRKQALAAFMAGMRGRALRDTDTQARLHARLGLPAARAIAAAIGGDPAEAKALFAQTRRDLPRIGGSHAQRDLFARIALDAALAAGDAAATVAQLAERATRRAPGAWETSCAQRLRSTAARPDAPPTLLPRLAAGARAAWRAQPRLAEAASG
jgi:hypothetical protein